MATVTGGFRMLGGWAMTGTANRKSGRRFGTAPYGSEFQLPAATNVMYELPFSLAAAASAAVDLLGGTGEQDADNATLSLARVTWLYLEITAPSAAKSIRLGPQAASNAWVGPWSDAADYSRVVGRFHQDDGFAVWPVVDATHKILTANNPSAGTVAGVLWVGGIHT